MPECGKCGDPRKEKGFCPSCQTCPNCGKKVKREREVFRCECGFKAPAPPEETPKSQETDEDFLKKFSGGGIGGLP